MYKVMLIDDEKSLHMAIEKLLTKSGYEYCGATDAESGLEMLATEKPDLLLLDVMLPGMNGFDLCTRIRAEGRRIPHHLPVGEKRHRGQVPSGFGPGATTT